MRKISRFLALPAAVMSIASLLAACGDDADPATTAATTPITDFSTTTTTSTPGGPPTDYGGFRNQETACGADQPPPVTGRQYEEPQDQGLSSDDTVIAVLETSCGTIVVELYAAEFPETVNSFVFLARDGFFDGSASHRISPGFVIQAGDPTATGFGGPGYVIADELPPPDFAYERGVVAMANAGPDSTGSQFFIMIGDAPLQPNFNVMGRVVQGMDVVDRIASLPTGVNAAGEPSLPLETLYINSVSVEVA